MAHHAHSVQGGLPVEQNVITVLEAPLSDHADTEVVLNLFGVILDFYHIYDIFVLSAVLGGFYEVFNFSLLAKFGNPGQIAWNNFLRDG